MACGYQCYEASSRPSSVARQRDQTPGCEWSRKIAYAGVGSPFGLSAINGYMEPPPAFKILLHVWRVDILDLSQQRMVDSITSSQAFSTGPYHARLTAGPSERLLLNRTISKLDALESCRASHYMRPNTMAISSAQFCSNDTTRFRTLDQVVTARCQSYTLRPIREGKARGPPSDMFFNVTSHHHFGLYRRDCRKALGCALSIQPRIISRRSNPHLHHFDWDTLSAGQSCCRRTASLIRQCTSPSHKHRDSIGSTRDNCQATQSVDVSTSTSWITYYTGS